jgi:hypothetical protein
MMSDQPASSQPLPNQAAHAALDRDESTPRSAANRKWSLHPMVDHPPERKARNMLRTQRQATLVGRVRIAMRRRDERPTRNSRKAPATGRRFHVDSEQMARWENDGGAIGHSAAQRPRPFP